MTMNDERKKFSTMSEGKIQTERQKTEMLMGKSKSYVGQTETAYPGSTSHAGTSGRKLAA
jgi:hypothetical protein